MEVFAMANPYAKRRTADNPYATYVSGYWTWKILRLNQSPEKASGNQYAVAHMAVSSPQTFGSHDMGDNYLDAIPRDAKLTQGDDILALTKRR
jgi:hypothetical protein